MSGKGWQPGWQLAATLDTPPKLLALSILAHGPSPPPHPKRPNPPSPPDQVTHNPAKKGLRSYTGE